MEILQDYTNYVTQKTKKMSDKDNNGWSEHQKLVLYELERLDKGVEELDKKIDIIREKDLANIKSEIKLLQYKSTLWGGIAGGIPVLILVLIKVFGN